MSKKNLLPLSLMASSLVLLLVLQGIWLGSSYEKAYLTLRRQASDIFRNTLLDLRDSVFVQHVGHVDSASHDRKSALFFSLRVDTGKLKIKRSKGVHLQSMAEILVRGSRDSTKDIVASLSKTMRFGNGTQVVVRYTIDSLPSDTIRRYYQNALAKDGIELPFTIRAEKPSIHSFDNENIPNLVRDVIREPGQSPEEFRFSGSSLTTDWVRFSPNFRYASTLEGVRPYLWMEISPQVMFSLALTLVTAAAFWAMYRSMRAQQKLMELKNDFISNITHELKTPVTTVSVALEALRNFNALENPKTTREYLDIAQGELNRLALLTDKVLKTAVFDSHGVNFEKEEVDMRRTVEQILHSMKLIFEKQKADVSFEQDGDSFKIQGGSVHLTNVVYNLLDNALKYSGGEPKITIRLEENQNRVVLKIADQGIGIPSEYRKKIFEKFFRVPTGDVHNIKGYGLGLSYVDSVIRSHHGFIEVSSALGRGSVFTISLPKAQS